MFARILQVTHTAGEANAKTAVPLAWLDSFAMRNFTNSVEFDDLLPVDAGLLEAGFRVPLPALTAAMEGWFRRKGWLGAKAHLHVTEFDRTEKQSDSPGPPGGAS